MEGGLSCVDARMTCVCPKAMSILQAIKRSFSSIDRKSFPILYKTYVRPHLEYCVQAWSPYLKKDTLHLEKVQQRATKLVRGLGNLPYEQRLQKLGLYSLEQRRLRGDLIETYKIMTGKENVTSEQFFSLSEATQLRGHRLKLFKTRSRLEVRRNFFSQRVVNPWNKLTDHVVAARTTNDFKTRLDRHWQEMGTKIGR